MAEPASQPTEAEYRDFAARLDKFHDSLPDNQKPILEQLTHAAVSEPSPEVEGFATLAEYPLLLAFIALLPHQQQNQQQSWMTRGVNVAGSKPLGGP
jgi:hypothetical protein